MSTIEIPCKTGEVSDGYHTFDELYNHRHALFCALLAAQNTFTKPWRSLQHEDGTMFEGMFIAGFTSLAGPVTYHMPLEIWALLDDSIVETLENTPEFDGHTSDDVIANLHLHTQLY